MFNYQIGKFSLRLLDKNNLEELQNVQKLEIV